MSTPHLPGTLEDTGLPGPVRLFLPWHPARMAEGGLRTSRFFKGRGSVTAEDRADLARGPEDGGNVTAHPERPLVSVITVVRDGAKYLEQTIRSVLSQTYDNLEYIIVDGASSDGTLEIIRKFEHAVDYWVSEPDNGIYDAMNKGISLSCGDYLNFLNCGDRFYDRGTVAGVIAAVAGREVDLIYGDSYVTHEDGTPVKRRRAFQFNRRTLASWGTRTLCHQAVLIKRSRTPRYDVRFKLKGELNWYFDILDRNPDLKVAYCERPIVYYRLGGLGAQQFYANFRERVWLIQQRYGWRKNVLNIPYYLVALGFHHLARFRS